MQVEAFCAPSSFAFEWVAAMVVLLRFPQVGIVKKALGRELGLSASVCPYLSLGLALIPDQTEALVN